MSDTNKFSKSTLPQGVPLEMPSVSKQWNSINHINGRVQIMVCPLFHLICQVFTIGLNYITNVCYCSKLLVSTYVPNTNAILIASTPGCASWATEV